MAQHDQLVCQQLEGISRNALEKYQSIVREYVRGRHGIYALYKGARLYYVGLASDLRFRLGQHLKDRHGHSLDRFSIYLTRDSTPLRDLEALILRVARPTGNRQIGRFSHCDDLRRRFARDVRAHFRSELSTLIGIASPEHAQAAVTAPASGRPNILAPFANRYSVLRAKFKGKLLKARVLRSGAISFQGKRYSSPSLAAQAACRRPTCNGWTFWKYKRAPGDWVLLDTLR